MVQNCAKEACVQRVVGLQVHGIESAGALCTKVETRIGKEAPTHMALNELSGFHATEKKPAQTTKITEIIM